MRNQLELATSLADMSKLNADGRSAETSKKTADLVDLGPAAVVKLSEKKGKLMKLTVADMKAIAFTRFAGAGLPGQKPVVAAGLKKLIEAQPTVLNCGPVFVGDGPGEAILTPLADPTEDEDAHAEVQAGANPAAGRYGRPVSAIFSAYHHHAFLYSIHIYDSTNAFFFLLAPFLGASPLDLLAGTPSAAYKVPCSTYGSEIIKNY